jgi:hypothetical protein
VLRSLFPEDGPGIRRESHLKANVVGTFLAIEEMLFEVVSLGRRKLVCHVSFGGLRANRFVMLHSMPQIDCEIKSLSVTKL